MGIEAVIIGSIITAAATSTASVVASRSQAGSAKRAADAEMDALDKQLAFEKEKEAERKAEWDRAQNEAKAQWEAEQASGNTDADMRRAEFELAKQKYTDRQAQMAPYRQVGVGALSQLAQLAGISGGAAPQAAAPAPLLETMPEGWKPGDPVTAGTPTSTATPDATATEDPSFLKNPDILPPTLAPEPTVIEAPAAAASMAPGVTEAAYQTLARPRSATSGALTPEQVAALVRAGGGRMSLSSLARSRRAQV